MKETPRLRITIYESHKLWLNEGYKSTTQLFASVSVHTIAIGMFFLLVLAVDKQLLQMRWDPKFWWQLLNALLF